MRIVCRFVFLACSAVLVTPFELNATPIYYSLGAEEFASSCLQCIGEANTGNAEQYYTDNLPQTYLSPAPLTVAYSYTDPSTGSVTSGSSTGSVSIAGNSMQAFASQVAQLGLNYPQLSSDGDGNGSLSDIMTIQGPAGNDSVTLQFVSTFSYSINSTEDPGLLYYDGSAYYQFSARAGSAYVYGSNSFSETTGTSTQQESFILTLPVGSSFNLVGDIGAQGDARVSSSDPNNLVSYVSQSESAVASTVVNVLTPGYSVVSASGVDYSQPIATPEPSTLVLLLASLLAALMLSKRRKVARYFKIPLLLLSALASAQASTLNFTVFSTAYDYYYYGFAYDPVTSTYYSHHGYGGYEGYDAPPDPVYAYTNLAAFASNSPTSGATLGIGPYGTYFAVNDGDVISRPDSGAATLSLWNAGNGALLDTVTFDGENGYAEFFGGATGMDVFQDHTGIYMMSAGPDYNWDIYTLTPDLTVTNMVDTGINQNYIGYAFLVNGTFFVGNSGVSNQVSYSINPTTGAVSPVNFTLNLPGSTSFYITNTVYDPNLDQLYIFNGNGTLYSLSNASVALGVPDTAATPEPGTLTLLGISLALMCVAHRRKPHA